MTRQTVHEEVYKGHKIKITQDYDPMSPADWDSPECVRLVIDPRCRYKFDETTDADVPEEWRGHRLPVYMYEHSGVTLSTEPFGCRWDSGQIGWIYYDPTYSVEWGGETHTARDIAVGHVRTWDQYLTGEVYCFDIEPENDDPLNLGCAESCCGVYGPYTDCLKQAHDIVDFHFERTASNKYKHGSYPDLVKSGEWL